MSLSIKTRGDVVAETRSAQSTPSTAGSFAGTGLTAGQLMHTDEASSLTIVEERRDNQDQKTGAIEATDIDILSKRCEGTLTVPRCSPDVLAWMASFFANNSTTITPAGATNARLHTMRVGNYAEAPPYFTAVHRKGGRGGAPATIDRIVGKRGQRLPLRAHEERVRAGVGGHPGPRLQQRHGPRHLRARGGRRLLRSGPVHGHPWR